MRLSSGCVFLLLVASLAISAPASVATAAPPRATVRVVGGEARYIAAPGVSDDPYVHSRAGADGELRFLSTNDMRAGTGCTRRPPTKTGTYRLHCESVSSVKLMLGDAVDV